MVQIVGTPGNDTLIGTSGDDFLTGGAGQDLLDGGQGHDTFIDTKAGFNGDTIAIEPGERIVFTDGSRIDGAWQYNDGRLDYPGGSLNILSAVRGWFVFDPSSSGLVMRFVADAVHNDFNGDGRSDILWRDENGLLFNWTATPTGGFVSNAANFSTIVSTEWRIAGKGDFNGDGREDLLWRQDVTGHLLDWLSTPTGGFNTNATNFDSSLPDDVQIVGVGDFNGDGIDDLLLRRGDGVLLDWIGNHDGGFASNAANFATIVGSEWRVLGVGDFDGDGRDDILWRQDVTGRMVNWLAKDNGSFDINGYSETIAPSWAEFVGIGEFRGFNHTDDLLWHDKISAFRVAEWEAVDGIFYSRPTDYIPFSLPRNDWHVISVGDFNGDGNDDLMWRQDGSGQLINWLGGVYVQWYNDFVLNDDFASSVPSNIHEQTPLL